MYDDDKEKKLGPKNSINEKAEPKSNDIMGVSLCETPQEFVIDEDTLWQYPIKSNPEVYANFASRSTKVILDGVLEFDLEVLLFNFFPHIIDLTLRNVQVSREPKYDEYPQNLRRLSLINCNVYRHFLIEWFGLMDDLESLHVQGKEYIHLPELRKLQKLTFLIPYEIDVVCPSLKSLTLDHCWSGMTYQQVKGYRDLNHLKVLRSVDWKHKEEIYDLKLKSLDVHFWEIPEKENLILRLNDDCLLYLQQFLSPEDWMTLHKTHPRFQKLAISVYEIYYESLALLPVKNNQQYYERIGPLVASLYINGLEQKELDELIPFFTNIQKLTLENTDSEEINVGTPNSLKKLSLLCQNCKSFKSLFRKLNSSLNALQIDDSDGYYRNREIGGLGELTNIHEFVGYEIPLTDRFLKFLKGNQNKMKTLCIRLSEFTSEQGSELMCIISRMESLSELTISIGDSNVQIMNIPNVSLPFLEKLDIECGQGMGLESFLMSLNCPKIKSFSCQGMQLECGQAISGRMKGLVHLNLSHTDGLWNHLFPTVCSLTKLQSLSCPLEDHHVLPLVKCLPQLSLLAASRIIGQDVIQDLQKYLKDVGQKLNINGFLY